ncbi:MAG: mechanosensitive ion channel family protein [Porticoccaceae bacterium]|nr:mechanosensitive ion channel family protein [Porticoccaceae bacterium]
MNFLTPLYEKFDSMLIGFVKILPLLGVAFFVIIFTWVLSLILTNLLSRSLSNSRIRKSLSELFVTLFKVIIWTSGILIAVTIIFPSLTAGKLLTALGLGSVAVGLAFKDIFENFFAGILIMLRKPMRIGDYIECEGIQGKVEIISIRETYLRQTDDQLVLVPNSFLFKNPLLILTDQELRRFDIVVGIAYDQDVSVAQSVIENAVSSLNIVNDEKPVEVYAREFNSSSIDFNVRWWAESTPLGMHQSKDQVVTTIKEALDKENIEIPFPYRTLTFKEPLNIQDTAHSVEN